MANLAEYEDDVPVSPSDTGPTVDGSTLTPRQARATERRSLRQMVLPMVPSDLIAVLVPMAVVVLMGRMGGDALYVRSLFTPVVFLFLALQIGLGITAQVAAAMNYGRGRVDEVVATTASLARLGFAAVAVVAAAIALLAPVLADLLAVDAGARTDFVEFVRWVAAAHLLVLGPVLCVSSLRGTGHPWPAATVMLSVAALEVGLVYVVGLRLGVGMLSVPIAALAANVAGTCLGLVLMRHRGVWRRGATMPWRPEVVGLLLQIGVPVGASFVVIFASNLALLWVVAAFGPVVVSGFATAATLQSIMIVPAVALGSAAAIVMNRHRGAGLGHRLMPQLRVCLEAGGGIYVVLSALCWLAREPLALALTGDATVAAETARYLHLVAPTYLLMGLVLVALTIMEQVGAGPLALALNAVYFGGVVVIGGYLARRGGSPEGLYATIAVANLFGLAVLPALVMVVRKAAKASVAAPPSAPSEVS